MTGVNSAGTYTSFDSFLHCLLLRSQLTTLLGRYNRLYRMRLAIKRCLLIVLVLVGKFASILKLHIVLFDI